MYLAQELSNNHKTKYSVCFAVPSSTSMALWHQRLAHTSYRTISKMATNEEVHGLNLPNNKVTPTNPCPVCQEKCTAYLSQLDEQEPTKLDNSFTQTFVGPCMYPHQVERAFLYSLHPTSLDGAMFVFSNISLKCRSSSKTTSVLYVVKLVISSIPSGQTNGGEFISSAFKLWLSNRSIRFESSAPHTPEQKGVAERANRTIVEAGRSLLYAMSLLNCGEKQSHVPSTV